MRVVHVVRSDAFAGVERYITMVAPALVARGFAVEVIGGDPVRMRSALPQSVKHREATSSPAVAYALLRSGRADVIHAHMTAAEMVAVGVSALRRSRVVATLHFAQSRGIPRSADRFISSRLSAQIAISDYVAQRVPGTTIVIPNGVASAELVPNAGRQVLVAQRLEREKRTDEAIRGWARSQLGSEGWRLVIAGDGAERPSLERLAGTLGVKGSVQFVGAQTDLCPIRAASAFQLAPRSDEPFGLSVAESMADGLVVLAADGGGHREILRDFPELLYPAGDPDALGAALRHTAERPDRPQLGARLQAVQRERYSIETHADKLAALYRSVCA